jgi:trimeric autotransporter adhesin
LTKPAKFSEKVFSQILRKTLLNQERIQTMKPLVKFKVTTPLLILLVLSCFALLPRAQAQAVSPDVSPAPDGFYAGFNTAEGFNALFNLTTGTLNTALGFSALKADTTGSFNTAVGAQALLHNMVGSNNTAVGVNALVNNTMGSQNAAVGQGALARNTTGNWNTAMGFQALSANIDGGANTAIGFQALRHNTNGFSNTATGNSALLFNTTGTENTADGDSALVFNTTGIDNTADGFAALNGNTTGSRNTANGGYALNGNTTGNSNTAIGFAALAFNSIGTFNTANGVEALKNNGVGFANTAVGYKALINNTTGGDNIALGIFAGSNITTGNDNIDIGSFNKGVAGESSTIRIGAAGFQTRTFIAGIRGTTTAFANAVPVLIDSAGQLGTASSSARFKNEIKPIDKASEAILALKPVTFHYKSDNAGTPQFGLIAEEVAQVNPDLVVRDGNGEIYTVRYDAVNAMLLNEFLKEHQKVQKLEAALAAMNERLKAQDVKIDRVNAKVEVSGPASQMALNEK